METITDTFHNKTQLTLNTIQGVDLLDVCKEFGTPLYVYDADKIVQQINMLRDLFSRTPLQIKYAAKSLTNLSILKLVKAQGIGLDVVSIEEAQLGIRAGFAPQQISYTPNCVSFEEIQEAVELGVAINIDNLPVLEQFGRTYGNKVPCCVRINPNIMAGGNTKISVGHSYSKFGISALQVRKLVQIVDEYRIDISGVHVHTGSDILDVDVFLSSAEVVFEVAKHFSNLRFIDFGSGFKINYHQEDKSTNLKELASRLQDKFLEFCEEYGKPLEMWLEPGKILVSESGQFLVKVNVVKENPAVTFVGVDSGFNHLIRPMFYDAYQHIENISNPDGIKKKYHVVGYICETDTFGSDRELNEVRTGDILSIKNAGAYGFSMASNYNSRRRPAEVMIYQSKAHLIRQRETMDDLIKNQIIIDI
ncbi:diaminopimelate decarboxylase [Catalinimonas alkaloidigena]|uniref:diaminopimelate decarboxylase n=1 Tax=Catalinimonas alkaloidigena TaxID=1075417 RepID=UPI0024063E8F|nr:diaminopimelate decarboxylase [Catalinimonas alkaloidigena]MDF9800545.1 diaminopimelate decarboxylase [Catalinimonas alkaloidigena]